MKKIAKILLMLTCVFGLTACGAKETVSEFQQQKNDIAKSRAEEVIKFTTILVSTSDVDEMLENYNNVELGDLFASAYTQYSGDSSFSCEGKAVNNALTSFQSGLEDIGSVKELGESDAAVDDDTIVVTVPVTGEKANGSVELIFTNDIYMKMTSCTLNLNETMGQLMTRAALNTLLGMGTVFVVLILICLIISAFALIPKIQASFSKKKEDAVIAPSAPAAAAETTEELADDLELVAVIAAAIAAYEGTGTEGFRVRSIKRANTNKWKKA